MGVLVEDLLTLARLDELREPAREEVDLSALARDAVDDARATAPDRLIDVEADGAAPVVGDPHQLRQVLSNLLRNALVHTPAGTPIEVTVTHDGVDEVVEVRDHGPGLPQVDGDLFERFWRAEGGRERGRGGAGLGLAIVAGIVEAHGGTRERRDGGRRRGAVPRPAARRTRARGAGRGSQPTPRPDPGCSQRPTAAWSVPGNPAAAPDPGGPDVHVPPFPHHRRRGRHGRDRPHRRHRRRQRRRAERRLHQHEHHREAPARPRPRREQARRQARGDRGAAEGRARRDAPDRHAAQG